MSPFHFLSSVAPYKGWGLHTCWCALHVSLLLSHFPSLRDSLEGPWAHPSSTLTHSSGSAQLSTYWVLKLESFCVQYLWLVLFIIAYSWFLVAAYSHISLRLLIMDTFKSYSDCCLFKTFLLSYKCSQQSVQSGQLNKLCRRMLHVTANQVKIECF